MDDKLTRFKEILKAFNGSLTREEFTRAVSALMDFVREIKRINTENFNTLKQDTLSFSDKISRMCSDTVDEMKMECKLALGSFMERANTRLAELKDGEDGAPGKDGETIVGPPGKDGSPDTGDQIIDKINSADGLIKQEAVEGLDKLKKAVAEKTGNTTRIGWGAHPLVIQGLGAVIDKNTRVINFTGSGLSSVTRTANGVVTVALQAGSSTTYSETPSGLINGSNTSYTTAHAITTVFNFAINGQFLHPTTDYTVSGTTITMVSALDASLSGKPFTITYQ